MAQHSLPCVAWWQPLTGTGQQLPVEQLPSEQELGGKKKGRIEEARALGAGEAMMGAHRCRPARRRSGAPFWVCRSLRAHWLWSGGSKKRRATTVLDEVEEECDIGERRTSLELHWSLCGGMQQILFNFFSWYISNLGYGPPHNPRTPTILGWHDTTLHLIGPCLGSSLSMWVGTTRPILWTVPNQVIAMPNRVMDKRIF